MNIRLNGISFVDLPHISTDEDCYIIREEGEWWDSEARPAYSVRIDGGYHVGYIPLVETLKMEALRARDGYRKVFKKPYDTMDKEEFRKIASELKESGEAVSFSDWVLVGKDDMRSLARRKMEECEYAEMVRDWLFCEIMRNHLTPHGRLLPLYYHEKRGRNYDEIGDVCSISVALPVEGVDCRGWVSATDAQRMTQSAYDNDD